MIRGGRLLATLVCAAIPTVVAVACGKTTQTGSPVNPSDSRADLPASSSAAAAPTGSAAEPKSAGGRTLPDCAAGAGAGPTETPVSDAGVMNNATPDASFDRSPKELIDFLASQRDHFRCCYDWAEKQHPGLRGVFVLEVLVAPDGTVKTIRHNKEGPPRKEGDATKDEPVITDDDMGACALAVAESVVKPHKFSPSKKGKESTVNYPYGFKPKRR